MQLTFQRGERDFGQVDLCVTTVTPKDIKKLTDSKKLPATSFGRLAKSLDRKALLRITSSEFQGKPGEAILIDLPQGSKTSTRLLITGWDDTNTKSFETINRYRKLGVSIQNCAKRLGVQSVALISDQLDWNIVANQDALYEGLFLSTYNYTRYKTDKKKLKAQLKKVTIFASKFKKSSTLNLTAKLCQGTFLARDLINTPALDCPPSELVKAARKIARNQKLKINVYNRPALKKMGAGGILGVSMASANEPFLIKLSFKAKSKRAKKIAIIGKGVTFDSGGLSIKPAQGMETMKGDMSGAAAVLGVMSTIRTLNPNAHVTGYIPTCENMVASNSLRPGDVIKIMSGKSVEVLNTDAEGRLILADAITLAVRDDNDILIDLATLTGACVVALGNDYAGLFSDEESLTKDLLKAAELSGERFWPLPLAQEYVPQIKSTIADIKNIGSRSGGGAITAALFLEQFTNKKTWAHLDIAGPAFRDSDGDISKAGGVGFGVRTIARYLHSI